MGRSIPLLLLSLPADVLATATATSPALRLLQVRLLGDVALRLRISLIAPYPSDSLSSGLACSTLEPLDSVQGLGGLNSEP